MAPTLQSSPVRPARIARAEHAAESYEKVEDQILALPAQEVGRVTADIPTAASIALGALDNLEQLRPEFQRLNDGGATVKALDSLQDYALAAFFAHLESVPDASQSELAALIERAKPLRENLLRVADGLAAFGLFSPSAISAIRDGSGYLDMAKDLAQLGALFTSNWDAVESKVPFDRALVDEASRLGTVLLRTIGVKEVGEIRKDTSQDWASLRARAFRLLARSYAELRRATQYVRWYHSDAEAYAPSLHARKARRTATGDEETGEAPLRGSEQVERAGDPPVAAGLPGTNPFESE